MAALDVVLGLYTAAFVGYVVLLCLRTGAWAWLPSVVLRVGWVAHTWLIAGRWMDLRKGFLPCVGLYEGMVFYAWVLVASQIFVEWRTRARWTGAFVAALACAAVGVSVFYFEPHGLFPSEQLALSPALQSRWIWLHATSSALGDGFFLVAAAMGIFSLIKGQVRTDTLLFWVSVFALAVYSWFYPELVSKLGESRVGYALLVASFFGFAVHVCVCWIARVLGDVRARSWEEAAKQVRMLIRRRRKNSKTPMPVEPPRPSDWPTWVARGVFALSWVATLGVVALTPWSIIPYVSAALFTVSAWGLIGLCLVLFRERLEPRVPTLDRLDRWGYQIVLMGFPLFTIGMLSGSIWAYFSWGSYWNWDIKQSWTLIIWLYYSVYLHWRLTASKRKEGDFPWTAVAWMGGGALVLFSLLGLGLTSLGSGSLHRFIGDLSYGG